MAKVKNVSNQPLYLNLPGNRTVKVPARITVDVQPADLDCPTILFHLNHGTIIIVDREEA